MEEPQTTIEPQAGDEKIRALVELIEQADAVVVGSAAGMSAAGGDSYYDVNPTFLKYFGDKKAVWIQAKSLLFDTKIDKVLHRAAELKRGCTFATQGEAFKTEKPINRADALGIGW